MAALPSIPERVVTTQAGQSPISPADIAGPYTSLAKAMLDTSEGIENVQVKEATRDGPKAVTLQPDGTYSFDAMPDLSGKYGAVFNRSAMLAATAKTESAVKNQLLEKSIEFDGRPDEFSQFLSGYHSEMVGKATDLMRASVDKIVSDNGGAILRRMQVTRYARDTNAAKNDLLSQLTELDNKAAAIARGQGTSSAEYAQTQGDINAVAGQLTSDPRFGFSKKATQGAIDGMIARHKAEALTGAAERLPDSDPQERLQKFNELRAAIRDPSINLTPAERNAYEGRIHSVMFAKNAENKAAADANKQNTKELLQALKTNQPYDQTKVADALQQSLAVGDPETYYKISSSVALHDWVASVQAQPAGQRIQASRELREATGFSLPQLQTAKAIADEAGKQNVDAGLAVAVAHRESRLNPNAAAQPFTDASGNTVMPSARGLFQLTKDNRAKRGLADDAPVDQQISAGVAQLKDSTNATRAALGREPTPGEIYLGYFLGPVGGAALTQAPDGARAKDVLDAAVPNYRDAKGRTYGEAVLAFNTHLGDNPSAADLRAWADRTIGAAKRDTAIASTPSAIMQHRATIVDFSTDYSKKLSQTAEQLVASAEKGLASRKELSPDEITALTNGLREAGRPQELIDRVEVAFNAHDKFRERMGLPPNQRAAFDEAMRAKAQDAASPAERKITDTYFDTVKQLDEDMKSTPYSTAASRGLHNRPAQYDFTSPDSVEAVAISRVQQQRVQQNYDGSTPISIFEGNEEARFATELRVGDPSATHAMLASLGRNLPADVFRATMMTPGIRDALDAAARSYDPARLSTAMSTLDQLYRADPIGFKEVYKGGALDRLQTWQAFKDSLSPQQIAEKFQRADDPATHDARQTMVKEAGTKLGTVTPDDVAYQLGHAWPTTPGSIARNITGSQASAPLDPVQGQALVEDYKQTFAQRYADIGDVDKAKTQAAQSLSLRWGSSDVANNSLMLYPPERSPFYPAINGNHQWMKAELTADVVKYIADKRGVKSSDEPLFQDGFDVSGFDGDVGAVMPTGYSYRVLADPQTEAEIKNGQPPSYLVSVLDDKGVVDFVRGPDNRMRRYKWDAKPATALAEQKFGADRDTTLASQFSGPQP